MTSDNYDSALYVAFLKARHCAEALHTVHTIHSECGRYSQYYRETAYENLKAVADYFGCDLSPRAAQKDAA